MGSPLFMRLYHAKRRTSKLMKRLCQIDAQNEKEAFNKLKADLLRELPEVARLQEMLGEDSSLTKIRMQQLTDENSSLSALRWSLTNL